MLSVGGVGGSGTRVVAGLAESFGYFMGDDLNESKDNLAFTLLFKAQSSLLMCEDEFR